MEHLNEFNHCVNDLFRWRSNNEEEDEDLLLLRSLPSSFMHFWTTLIFGKETLRFEEVVQDIISHVKMNKSTSDEMKSYSSRGRMIIIGADLRKERTNLTITKSQDQYPRTVNMWTAIIATIRVTSKNNARSLKLIRREEPRKHHYGRSCHREQCRTSFSFFR